MEAIVVLLHEGGFRMELEGDEPVFYRPDGTRLADTAPLPGSPGFGTLTRLNGRAGLAINDQTAFPKWDGEPIDYDGVLWAMG